MNKITLSLLLFFAININTVLSQNKPKIDLMQTVRELIKSEKIKEEIKQVWWLPSLYWELALKDSDLISKETAKEINLLIEKYNIIIIVDANIGLNGVTKNKIKKATMVINGKKYKPLKEVSDELTVLIEALKPTFSAMLGQYGKAIEIFIFDNSHTNKVFPDKKGKFTIKFNNSKFEYSLPLPSLVSKKTCPFDKKLLNGNWNYCPWHGNELTH